MKGKITADVDELVARVNAYCEATKAAPLEPSPESITTYIRLSFIWAVREQLDKQDMTERKLARLTGLSPQRINKILSDQGNIELKTMAKIAVALGLPLSVSFGQPPAKPQPVKAGRAKAKDKLHQRI